MKTATMFIIGIALLVGISILLAFPTMWAWNGVMPYLFGFKEVSVRQAFWLNYLAGMFFKATSSGGGKE